MKFTTFRNIVIPGVALVVFGSCLGVVSCQQRAAQEAEAKMLAEAAAQLRARDAQRAIEEQARAKVEADARLAAADADRRRQQSPGAFFAAAPGLRDVDRDMLALLQAPVGAKIKDATKGKKYKINLYADDKVRFNRAKVDLDRDEKADEKWSFDVDGSITREVAPTDDENYTKTLRLDGTSGWIDLTAVDAQVPGPATVGPSAAAGGAGLRDVDRAMDIARRLPVQEKIKDATKGKPYKINLYSDDGTRFTRAKIDLDRDDKWDESWTFGADGSTERQVSPADDESYTEVWTLGAAGWKKK